MKSEVKIHKNLVLAVVETLKQIFQEGKYADKAIEKTLQNNKKWGARDRAFIAETTYELVRWWRLIMEAGRLNAVDKDADFWIMVGLLRLIRNESIPPWDEFKTINEAEVQNRLKELNGIRKIKESIPDWLDELGFLELKERWANEIQSLNKPAEVVLRANTLKTNPQELAKILLQENIETAFNNSFKDALFLQRRQNVFSSQAFKDGLFEVQDASSQLVAPALEVEPGMRVVDACAGGGGKTLHLAALMKNKGKIIAMDTEAWKLNNLKKRAARAGISIIEPRLIESTKTIKRLKDSADRLLLDVPCSGLGVLRRNPDAKWKLNMDFIHSIKATQQEILSDYSSMVKVNGKIIYSTCSILPSENFEQVDRFIQHSNSTFKKIFETSIYPSESGFDGFYYCSIQRLI